MKSAGVAELKAHLSEYLARVKRGAELVVTERGVPVARLVPLDPKTRNDSRRARLIRAGVIIPGRGRIRRSLLQAPKGELITNPSVLDALLAEREEWR